MKQTKKVAKKQEPYSAYSGGWFWPWGLPTATLFRALFGNLGDPAALLSRMLVMQAATSRIEKKSEVHRVPLPLFLPFDATHITFRNAYKDAAGEWHPKRLALIQCMNADGIWMLQDELPKRTRELTVRLTYHRPMPVSLIETLPCVEPEAQTRFGEINAAMFPDGRVFAHSDIVASTFGSKLSEMVERLYLGERWEPLPKAESDVCGSE